MKGYGTAPYGVVKSLNGVDVKNLDDLVVKLRDFDGEFISIEPYGRHETLVFRADEMASATEDVLNDEGIRYQYSDDVKKVWEAKPPEAAAAP